jgi:hypothetical protein
VAPILAPKMESCYSYSFSDQLLKIPFILPSFLPSCKQWQAIVNFGRWITSHESRVAGWYHSVMTIGPEPKPIQNGATLHTICVTDGPLSTYKLFASAYGGKGNEDTNVHNPHTVT